MARGGARGRESGDGRWGDEWNDDWREEDCGRVRGFDQGCGSGRRCEGGRLVGIAGRMKMGGCFGIGSWQRSRECRGVVAMVSY